MSPLQQSPPVLVGHALNQLASQVRMERWKVAEPTSALAQAATAFTALAEEDVARWARAAPPAADRWFSCGAESMCRRLAQQSPAELDSVLRSCVRRRAKSDRDPEVLAWMEGIVSAIRAQRAPRGTLAANDVPTEDFCEMPCLVANGATRVLPTSAVVSDDAERTSLLAVQHTSASDHVERAGAPWAQGSVTALATSELVAAPPPSVIEPCMPMAQIPLTPSLVDPTAAARMLAAPMSARRAPAMFTLVPPSLARTPALPPSAKDGSLPIVSVLGSSWKAAPTPVVQQHTLVSPSLLSPVPAEIRNRSGVAFSSRCPVNVLSGLTEQQKRAAAFPPERALLVVACAGSGKTKTLLARVQWLLASGAVSHPGRVLLLSFSRAACDELRQRLRVLDTDLSRSARVCTFHGFSLELLRSRREQLTEVMACPGVERLQKIVDGSADLRVVSESEQRQLLGVVIEAVVDRLSAGRRGVTNGFGNHLMPSSPSVSSALRFIQHLKSRGVGPADAQGKQVLVEVFRDYEARLASVGAADFADLVSLAGTALARGSELRASVARDLDAVVVDEFQDTSSQQLALLVALVADRPGKLTAVGDPRQRIFSFQGSCGGQFEAFKARFGAAEIVLNENFRSTANICKFSGIVLGLGASEGSGAASSSMDSIVACHPTGAGMPVEVVACRTVPCEAFHVQTCVLQSRIDGGEWRDLAVLCRTSKSVLAMAGALRAVGVPVVLAGSEHYSRREVEDVCALCRLALQPMDDHLVRHCLSAQRVASAEDVALLDAARRAGRQPPSVPSISGASSVVTAKIARTLEGHQGRRARFLLGDPLPLSELLRELRAAVFPAPRRGTKGHRSGSRGTAIISDETLRAGLLMNGVAFLDEANEVVWPAPRSGCRCGTTARASCARASRAPSATATAAAAGEGGGVRDGGLCLACGGIVAATAVTTAAGAGTSATPSEHSCCWVCGDALRAGGADPACSLCGRGYHLEGGETCAGIPKRRRPLLAKCVTAQPWLCAGCYASYASAWWERQCSGGFAAAPRTVRGILRQIPDDAPELGLPHGSLWQLCHALSTLTTPPAWLKWKTWSDIRRFIRTVEDLALRVEELRLPELLSRVLAILPKTRRYRGGRRAPDALVADMAQQGFSLEGALRAEAETHLRESPVPVRAEHAAAQLCSFLERLELDECSGFAGTAAGSGTADAGRGRDAVTVATVHAAKGRQWRHVLLTRFNDELGFPLGSPTVSDLWEERRLAYVAASRAKERLTVSYVLEVNVGLLARKSHFLEGLHDFGRPCIGAAVESYVEFVDSSERQRLAKAVQELGGPGLASSVWQQFVANPRKPPAPLHLCFKRRLRPRSDGSRCGAGDAPKRLRASGDVAGNSAASGGA